MSGIVAGVLANMFGFGGGFVVVPLLFWLLPLHGEYIWCKNWYVFHKQVPDQLYGKIYALLLVVVIISMAAN